MIEILENSLAVLCAVIVGGGICQATGIGLAAIFDAVDGYDDITFLLILTALCYLLLWYQKRYDASAGRSRRGRR